MFRLRWVPVLALACVFFLEPHLRQEPGTASDAPPLPIRYLMPGWQLSLLQSMPEKVASLASYYQQQQAGTVLFVGTSTKGSVYQLIPDWRRDLIHPVGLGLGDYQEYGTCEVSSLSVRDLNQDGIPELVAGTSQIMPTGRPRVYVWSLEPLPVLLGFVRPSIKSSWCHGFGFLPGSPGGYESIVSTFCGHGEIMQFQLREDESATGFRSDTFAWRKLGQMPTSGEQALTADVDNGGDTELCLALGFSIGNAQIDIFHPSPDGIEQSPRLSIDEGHRFGNVRMFVTHFDAGNCENSLLAWWCTDLASGRCEIIRYTIEGDTITAREVVTEGGADLLWPRESQITAADSDGDGNTEIWFATNHGEVWRYDPSREPALAQVCAIDGDTGPIAALTSSECGRQTLCIGWNQYLLELRMEQPTRQSRAARGRSYLQQWQ